MILEPLDKRFINWDLTRFQARDCPFCGTKNIEPSYIRPDNCSVLICSKCSSFYVSPSPSEDALTEFYTSYHGAHFGGNVTKNIEDVKSELDGLNLSFDPRFIFLKKDMLSNKSVPYQILDFGCGTGSFLYQAKRLGASVTGIEFDSSAVAICHNLGIESVFLGGLDILRSLDKKYNLIVLNDVIEHIINPDQLVSILCGLLSENGKILIWTPNGDAIGSDPQKITLRVDLEHMQYLTSRTVKEICFQNELTVYHYQQLGFPSNCNFIDDVINRSRASTIKFMLVVFLKYLGLANFVKRWLSWFDFIGRSYTVDGNYHLFCVLCRCSDMTPSLPQAEIRV